MLLYIAPFPVIINPYLIFIFLLKSPLSLPLLLISQDFISLF